MKKKQKKPCCQFNTALKLIKSIYHSRDFIIKITMNQLMNIMERKYKPWKITFAEILGHYQ